MSSVDPEGLWAIPLSLCLLRSLKGLCHISSLLNACLHLDIHERLCCERLAEHECPEYMGAVVWRAILKCNCFRMKVVVRELICERWDGMTQRRRCGNKKS